MTLMKALVIGGGIGGMAAGIALLRAGIAAVVVERAQRLEEVGAGLTLAPNALCALDLLGLGEHVRAVGSSGNALVVRTARGRTLMSPRLDPGQVIVGVHRSALQETLREALGADALRLRETLESFAQQDDDVVARLEDGREERGDVLIGADGIGSAVRAQLLADGPPRYAGYAGWRAVVEVPPGLVQRGTFSESWGRGLRFGIVDIGGGRVYWFVSETCREGSWERPGVKSEFLRRFRGWHAPVESLIEATPEEAITVTGIYDRPPARRWGVHRTTLLGDAAHPMTPNIGQGACQALEDAVVLARCLSDAPGPEGLRQYERLRIPRTSALVRRSRQLGALAQTSKPPLTLLRDTLVRATPARVQRAQQRQVLEVEL